MIYFFALLAIAFVGVLFFGGHEDDWRDMEAEDQEGGLE